MSRSKDQNLLYFIAKKRSYLKMISTIFCEDIMQHHINQNRVKEGKRIKRKTADQKLRA